MKLSTGTIHIIQTKVIVPAVRCEPGRWKLIEHFEAHIPTQLFDLENDPGETENVAARYPAEHDRLLAMLRTWREEVDAEVPQENPCWDMWQEAEAQASAVLSAMPVIRLRCRLSARRRTYIRQQASPMGWLVYDKRSGAFVALAQMLSGLSGFYDGNALGHQRRCCAGC